MSERASEQASEQASECLSCHVMSCNVNVNVNVMESIYACLFFCSFVRLFVCKQSACALKCRSDPFLLTRHVAAGNEQKRLVRHLDGFFSGLAARTIEVPWEICKVLV